MSQRFAISVVRYDDDKSALIRDCMLPMALELAKDAAVEQAYLERHWLRGPRVRLCLRVDDSVADDKGEADNGGAVRRRISERVLPTLEAYVAAHPSTASLDEDEYLRMSANLGIRELVKPPYGPLSADNLCEIEEHEPRADLLGGIEAVSYYEEYLSRAMAPVAAHLEAAHRDRHARLDYAVRIMTMLAASYHGGVVAGTLSYRSHLEYFLHESDKQGRIEARFAEHFEKTSEAVVTAVRTTIDAMDDGIYTGDEPILRQWGALFSFGRSRGLELAEAKHISEDPGPLFRPVAKDISADALKPWVDYEGRTWSDFHDTLLRGSTLPYRVNVEIFAAYRWMVNLYYTLLKLIGITPMERYFLNYLLSRAVEEVSGISWKDHLTRVYKSYGIDLG